MFKKFSLYTLAMLLIPVVTWLANWHWSLAIQYAEFDFDYFLYLITETGSVPYAIITCVVFALLLAWVVHKRYSLIFVITVCVASMVATQAIKTAMKSTFQEPRPFVTALFQDKTDDFLSINTRATWACRNGKNRCKSKFCYRSPSQRSGLFFPIRPHYFCGFLAIIGGRFLP